MQQYKEDLVLHLTLQTAFRQLHKGIAGDIKECFTGQRASGGIPRSSKSLRKAHTGDMALHCSPASFAITEVAPSQKDRA